MYNFHLQLLFSFMSVGSRSPSLPGFKIFYFYALSVWLFLTPWTIACQASLSMEYSKQEHRSGLPFPTPRDLPNPEIEPRTPTLQADSLRAESRGKGCLQLQRHLYWRRQLHKTCQSLLWIHNPRQCSSIAGRNSSSTLNPILLKLLLLT